MREIEMKKIFATLLVSFIGSSAFAGLEFGINEIWFHNALPPSGKGVFNIHALREVKLPDDSLAYVVTFDSGPRTVVTGINENKAYVLAPEEVELVNAFLKASFSIGSDAKSLKTNYKQMCGSLQPSREFNVKGGAYIPAGMGVGCSSGLSDVTKAAYDAIEKSMTDGKHDTLSVVRSRLKAKAVQ